MGKKKQKAKQSSGKVFRVAVLGRAEAGKTSLCMRYISNTVMKGYEHTIDSQIYHREVDTKALRPKQTNSLSGDTSKKKKQKPTNKQKKKKKKQELNVYGLQIEDVPGEISGNLEERTAEKDTINRDYENNGYKQLYHDSASWLGVPEPSEGSPLIPPKRKGTGQLGAEIEKHVNLLYIPMKTCGYIVMFDVTSSDSLSKAKKIIQEIHRSPNKNAPILLLGNKTDISRNPAEAINKANNFCLRSKVYDIHFAYGSTNRNEFEYNDESMDCYNLMNDFVQHLNIKNCGVDGTEYDARFAKSKRGRRKGRIGGPGDIDDDDDDESKRGGCCSWLFCDMQCCNCWGTNEDDEEIGEMATNV